MNWTPENMLGTFAVVVAMLGVVVSLFTAARSASKDGFEQLKAVVEDLRQENESLRKRVEALEIENHALRIENDYLKANTKPLDSGRGFARR